MFTCVLCDEDSRWPSPTELLDHVRNLHPDSYDSVDRYPDGEVVVEDDCPEYMVSGRAPYLVDVT